MISTATTKTATTKTLLCLFMLLCASAVRGQDELARRATWSSPTAAEVKAQLDRWLAERELTEAQQAQIDALWQTDEDGNSASDPSTNLSQLVESAALAWPAAEEIVAETRQTKKSIAAKSFQLLAPKTEESSDDGDANEDTKPATETGPTVPSGDAGSSVEDASPSTTQQTAAELEAWIVNNLRLHYARWLAQHELYDESLELIEPLSLEQVVDPASLLFYQSAAYHFLLKKTEGLAAIDKLLENEETIARRYAITAKLMAADLKPLQADSLDEVARMMGDIERRLRLQRAGQRVRQEEDDVVAKLDKMIKELEDKKKDGSGGGGAAGNSNQPSAPMEDSRPGGASGEGNVDPKRLADRENWGNLPPKERQEALQQITKELPAHYREAVEEYFRKLARDGVNP
jgi:hypothetical protein